MACGKNATFCGADPSWANACVGNNGNPGYADYAEGFSSAANVLIEQVISGGGLSLNVDSLIYPVCFNMRHSVELRLKGAIEELGYVASKKGKVLRFDLVGSHDIGNIWLFFKEQSESLDERYVELNKKVESTIGDLAEVDATGQVFRYPENNENQKHLTDVASINFFRIREKFSTLENGLKSLHRVNVWLREEYSQGTFTDKFSRPMLYRLARNLPPKNSWASPEFGLVKRDLMERYGVSSRELSRAIEKIKRHYYLASIIASPLKLRGVSPEQIFEFFECWTPQNLHNQENESSGNLFCYMTVDSEKMIREIVERTQGGQTAWNYFLNIMSPEYLAGIRALFYFARDKRYVEYYDELYESQLSESFSCFDSGEACVKRSFMHIFNKTNAIDNILIALYALGYVELAEEVLNRYGAGFSFHWLEDARSGKLFEYPDYAKY